MNVDPAQDAAVCSFCRTPFVVEKAVAAYESQITIEHADTVVHGADTVNIRPSGVASVVGFVERQLKRRQQKEDEAKAREEAERLRIEALPPVQRLMKKYGVLFICGGVMLLGFIMMITIVIVTNARDAAGSQPDENGFITVPSSSTFDGKDYHGVLEELADRGFTNVEARPLGDLITGWLNKPDEVDELTVAGNSDYSDSKRYPPNVEIVVWYHSYPEDDDAASASADADAPADPVESPAASASTESGESDAQFAQRVRTKFLAAWDVETELELIDAYLDSPIAPTYAITSWEGVGGWVRVYVQETLSNDEVLAVGKQILGLTCTDITELAGVIVRGADGLDHNVARSAMPLCVV